MRNMRNKDSVRKAKVMNPHIHTNSVNMRIEDSKCECGKEK